MKHFTKKIFDWFAIWIWFLLIIWFVWITYAAWTTMTNVTTWDPLTATSWNNLLWNVEILKTNTTWITSVWGNVWVWVPTATEKLDVAWTVKATKVDSSKAAFVRVSLNACSGPCAGNHTLNAWYNVAGYNHIITNNDTATFTTWTTGNVTINKTGTYMIRISMMNMPASDLSLDYASPYINWSLNTLWWLTWDYALHDYTKASYWKTVVHIFEWNLTAWDTVGYGYYPYSALNNWGHDGYTGMEITKLN